MGRILQFDYFESFEQVGTLADAEADRLLEILENFDPEKLREQLDEMHEIEHAADMVNHELYINIITEFITPIDREDILILIQELDEIADRIEDVLQYIYMYDIKKILPEAIEMVVIIAKSTEALRQALMEFPKFKKSKTIRQYIIDVNTYEEEADRLYIATMRELYTSNIDPIKVLAWTNIFDQLERCCDSCERVAGVMETIMMKSS
ncbi:MAG: DUF47 family protein [Actinobacteria bacterium]|nr:DUF47 family protein [Actinomycetota bacterium]